MNPTYTRRAFLLAGLGLYSGKVINDAHLLDDDHSKIKKIIEQFDSKEEILNEAMALAVISLIASKAPDLIGSATTEYHEAGHVLASIYYPSPFYLSHAKKLKDSAVGLKGFVHFNPPENDYKYSEQDVKNLIIMSVAGKCAEIEKFGASHKPNGCGSDFRKARVLADTIIENDKLNALKLTREESITASNILKDKLKGLKVSRFGSAEINAVIDEAENEAKKLMRQNRHQLDLLATALKEHGTLSRSAIFGILGLEDPQPENPYASNEP